MGQASSGASAQRNTTMRAVQMNKINSALASIKSLPSRWASTMQNTANRLTRSVLRRLWRRRARRAYMAVLLAPQLLAVLALLWAIWALHVRMEPSGWAWAAKVAALALAVALLVDRWVSLRRRRARKPDLI